MTTTLNQEINFTANKDIKNIPIIIRTQAGLSHTRLSICLTSDENNKYQVAATLLTKSIHGNYCLRGVFRKNPLDITVDDFYALTDSYDPNWGKAIAQSINDHQLAIALRQCQEIIIHKTIDMIFRR